MGKDAHAMTITLLTDSQGKKMGKTAGNAVWLDPNKTSPFAFYQYWRNVDDADVMKCLRMLTFLSLEELADMDKWDDGRINEKKEKLAWELTALVHGEAEADKAQAAARAGPRRLAVREGIPLGRSGYAVVVGVCYHSADKGHCYCASIWTYFIYREDWRALQEV